jgi:hypothetical protein
MANFWDNDQVAQEPWAADPEVGPRAAPTIDAVEQPSYLEAFGERAMDLGRSVARTPGVLRKTIPAMAKNMAAGVERGLSDINTGMDSAAAQRYREYQSNDPRIQAQQQTAADEAEQRAFAADMQSGRMGRTARRASIEGEQAIPADAGPIERATQQGLTSAALAVPAVMLGGPVGGATALGVGTAGSRYTDLIDKGVPREAAVKSSLMMGSLETLTEFLPGETLVKNVPNFWKKVAEFMATELPGENVTSLAQLADDYRLQLRDDVTKDDVLAAIQDTTLQTLIGGGAQVGAAQLLQQAVEKANAKPPEMDFGMKMPEPVAIPPEPLALPAKSTFVPPDSDFVVDSSGYASPSGQMQPQLEQKPEVPTGHFEPTDTGELRELTTPEVSSRDQETERLRGLGLPNVERYERVGRETSPPAPDVPTLQAAKDGTASTEQIETLKASRYVNNAGKLLPAGRRALKTAKTESVVAEAKLAGQGARVTVRPVQGRWVLAIDDEDRLIYDSEKLAREDAVAARQSLSGPVEVLGQQVEHPAEPTAGQKGAGNYKKPTIPFAGMQIAIENLTGSTREGKSADGKSWARTMRAPYGYVKRTEGADGDPVDVYLGRSPNAPSVYVIDQLSPNGKQFDEHKAVIGVDSQEEAEALYLKHYPKGWKGMGAVTALPVSEFKTWAMSGDTKAPLAWKTPEDQPKRSTRAPQPEQDSILEFISKTKLSTVDKAGLDLDALAAEGLDVKELRAAKGHGINRPFTKGGASLDAMAETLAEAGYPVLDERGNYDKNKLLDLITKELRTGKRVTAQAKNFDLELEALSKKFDQPKTDPLNIPEDLTQMSDEDLADLQRRIDQMGEMLSEAESKVEARRERRAIEDEPMFHRAYHGSPHKFGKFKLDETTIGTGEGGQAYGWGLYFAENPTVADQYRPQVTWKRSYKLRGHELVDIYSKFSDQGKYDLATIAERILTHQSRDRIEGFIRENWDDPDASQREAINWFKSLPRSLFAKPGGVLYQVDINDEAIPRMMDWDAGFIQQPEAVRKAFEEADLFASYKMARGQPINTEHIAEDLTITAENEVELHDKPEVFETIEAYKKTPDDPMLRAKLNRWFQNYPYDRENFKSVLEAQESEWSVSIGHFYRNLATKLRSEEAASLYLKDRGVPGIRYLDQASRDIQDGTHNLVVFDDSIVTVTHVDGTPITAQERNDVVDQMFHRAEGKQPGNLTERAVRAKINELLKGFKVRPPLTVVQSVDQLPASVRSLVPDDDIRAFMYQGKLYVIADRVPSLDDLAETVKHEVVVHFGLRAVIDPELRAEIRDGIARDNPMELRRRGRQEFGEAFDPNNDLHRQKAAEEILAYHGGKYLAGESIPERIKRWLDKLFAAIRDWARSALGKDQKYDTTWMKKFVQDLQDHLRTNPEQFDDTSTEPAAQRAAPTFYSALTRAGEQSKTGKAPATQWLNTLRNAPGVKAEEIEWSGVEEWLNSLGRPATREELGDFLRANEIQVQDAIKGAPVEGSDSEGRNRYAELQNRISGGMVELDALGYSIAESPEGDLLVVTHRQSNDEYEIEAGTGDYRWVTKDGKDLPADAFEIAHRVQLDMHEQYNLDRTLDDEKEESTRTRYETYTLPGGENYRELLLTLPRRVPLESKTYAVGYTQGSTVPFNTHAEAEAYNQQVYRGGAQIFERERRGVDVSSYNDKSDYNSNHWSEPNILAHVRFNERTDADGKRVLHIEEIQSDWHQAGRKRGYQDWTWRVEKEGNLFKVYDEHGELFGHALTRERAIADANRERNAVSSKVPDAPFKTTWPELAFKRMIRWAAENGFERISWTPGQQQADRYDLSKHINRIRLQDNSSGGIGPASMEGEFERGMLYAYGQDGRVLERSVRSKEEIAELIGPELTERLLAEPPFGVRSAGLGMRERELTNLDTRVGGEGMIGFYDQILPATVNKMVKKWGAKVGTTFIPTKKGRNAMVWDGQQQDAVADLLDSVHSVDVTDSMRAAALEGLPMFQRNEEALGKTHPSGDMQGGYKAAANRAIDAWNSKVGWRWGPLGKLPQSDAYLRLRYKTLGDLTEIRGIARDIYDTMRESSEADSQAAYEYLTTREASADAIQDEKIRALAQSVKERFDVQGQRMVDAGLIPQEAFDKYAGQYLPRLYLKHILGDQLHAAMGTGKKTSNLGQTKKRKDIPEDIRKVILGEITDPAFLASFGVSRTMRDLAMLDFMESVSKNEAWTPPEMLVDWNGRKVSPFWMHQEAVRLRKQADFMKGHALATKARDIADRMDTLANAAISRLERADLDGFKQIPDSPRYGALRGLWVREEIFEDMVGAQNFIDPSSAEAWVQKWAGKATRAWKTSKVALNPPSHFRNMMGNSIMLQMSGVPFHRQPLRLGQAIQSLREKDRFYDIARKYGMFEATFSNIELARIADEWLALQDTNKSHFGWLTAATGRITNRIGDVYQFEEALFKLTKLRDNMEQGMEEGDAMIDAHKWLFDYSLVPRWVRWLRNAPLGTPFLTYTYKAIPRMLETLVRTPWRYLPYVAGYYALQELLEYAFDVDDDDLKKLEKAYPEWTQKKGGLMLLPTRDANGNLQLFDMGYTVPWGMLADVARQGQEMEGGMMLDSMGVMSGPVADLISAWQTGIDPFTRREIVDKRDTPKEQMKQRFWYAWSLAAPGWLTPSGASGKLYDFATGAVDKRTGEQKLTGPQVAARFFGLTVYPVNPVESRKTNIYFMQRDIDEIRFRMKQRLKDKNLDMGEKTKLRSDFNELVKRKQQELQQYKKDSEVHPNLRNQSINDKVGSLIGGKRKPEAVKALRDAGYPAFAALIDEMPARPRPAVAQALMSMRA